jgi:hypothetical protein
MVDLDGWEEEIMSKALFLHLNKMTEQSSSQLPSKD